MPIPPTPDIAGHPLDGGTFTIAEAEDRALRASIGSPPASDGAAHPVWYYVATQVGMGETVAGLCALCGFDIEDGPMMAGSEVEFFAPLRIGQPYRVRGAVLGLTRKQSRRLGTMDLLDYALHLDAEDGTRVCSVRNAWVLPRGSDDAR
jgi:hypothetical protein